MNSMGRMSPHNCTECELFEGNLVFRSDFEPWIEVMENVIWFDCKRYHKHYCHNELIVCDSFSLSDRKSIVELDKAVSSHYYRVYRRISKPELLNDDISQLERLIYDRVCQVSQICPEGYSREICITRTHLDTGIEKMRIWMKIMEMIQEGIIVVNRVEFVDYLKPACWISNIGDIVQKGR